MSVPAHDTEHASPWPWTPRERFRLAQLMRHSANIMSLSVVGDVWPDWMTPERRAEMAADFRKWAEVIEPKRPPKKTDATVRLV